MTAFALKNWKLIGIGILALLLGIQTMRLSGRTDQRDKARAETQLEITKHAVTLASLKSVTDALNDQNARVELLAVAAKRKQDEAARALAGAREASRSAEERARRIEAVRPSTGLCRTDRSIMEAGL